MQYAKNPALPVSLSRGIRGATLPQPPPLESPTNGLETSQVRQIKPSPTIEHIPTNARSEVLSLNKHKNLWEYFFLETRLEASKRAFNPI
jgi:hypothetical protein